MVRQILILYLLPLMWILQVPDGAWANVEASAKTHCHVESNPLQLATQCSGEQMNGLCSGEYFIDVTFDQAFDQAPHIFVSPAQLPADLGCMRKKAGSFRCRASDISPQSFRLWCSATPRGDDCKMLDSNYESGREVYARAAASWLALSSDPTCMMKVGTESSQKECLGKFDEGVCTGSFQSKISFEPPYSNAPHILAAPLEVGRRGFTTAGSFDAFFAHATASTSTGFLLLAGWSSRETSYLLDLPVNWLAMESSHHCQVESQHLIDIIDCPAHLRDGLCAKEFEQVITFDKTFSSPPHVVVAVEGYGEIENVCSHGGAFYGLQCYPLEVTTSNFRVRCGAWVSFDHCGEIGSIGFASRKIGYVAISRTCSSRSN